MGEAIIVILQNEQDGKNAWGTTGNGQIPTAEKGSN